MIDPFIGQNINGKFRVMAHIGRGGMGTVYRAEQVPLGRSVALKVLRNRPGVVEIDPSFQRRFFLEASLCAKISHPNIVTIYDYGRIEGAPEEAYFMAMELLEGETLLQRLRLREAGMLSVAETLHLGVEMARGLREAHKHGIVHRDLKPGNVMLVPGEEGEQVKILDFGLVKQVDGEEREDLTQEGSFLGSPKYMSPEQISQTTVDHRTDLYSLGVMLYQCLTGSVPFEAATSMGILLAHSSAPVPPMREKNPGCTVPESLEALVRKLLEKQPAQRPASAEALIQELRAIRSALGLARETGNTETSRRLTLAEVPPVVENTGGTLAATSLSGRRPSAAPTARSRTGATMAVVTGIALACGVALWLRRPRSASAPSVAASHAATAAAVIHAPAMPIELAHRTHALRVESVPPGASIMDGDRLLGATPFSLAIDPQDTRARHLVLTLPGYLPFTVDQPPLTDDVRVVAALTTAPAIAPAATDPSTDPRGSTAPGRPRVVRRGPARAASPGTTSGSTAPARPLDIITER